jgi:hypothetical protein
MPLGIGGGGQVGFAFEVLPPPVATSATPVAGGALTAGTYKYYITAINALGETTISNELTGTTAAANLTLTLLWAAVTGATGYKVYRTAAGGGTGTELLLVTLGAVTTYNDAAVGAPAGVFPTISTAGNPGVYIAPAKFIPISSESLQSQQNTTWRRPIRKSVGVQSAIAGDFHVEGDISFEITEDVLPYFMFISRMDVVRTGVTNITYTGTPNALAVPARTASITIERVAGVVFGYVGCVVSSFNISVQDAVLMYSASIIARDEASQTVPVPTWPTTTPYGSGMYTIEVPTGSVVTDTDTFEFTVEDNGEPQYRLKSTGRGADFVKYGERNCTLTMERDFVNRTDYDAFKAYTSQAIKLLASKGVNNSVQVDLLVAIKDTFEVTLSSQGDLVRARVAFQNIVNATGAEYTLTVKTQELIS